MMEEQKSSFIDSALATSTITTIRQTTSGVWRTAIILYLSFMLWAALQPGALEQYFDISWRWQLEQKRFLLGPLCLLPVMVSAFFAAKKLFKSPSLSGRGILLTLVLMAVVVMGGLMPYFTWKTQMINEERCKENLSTVYALWKMGGVEKSVVALPACPCQWDKSLGNYKMIEGDKIVAVDLYPWHPHGRLAVTVDGDVVFLAE